MLLLILDISVRDENVYPFKLLFPLITQDFKKKTNTLLIENNMYVLNIYNSVMGHWTGIRITFL